MKTDDFRDLTGSLTRNRFIVGKHNDMLTEGLLLVQDLTSETCVTMCKAAERTKEYMNRIGVNMEIPIN